MVGGNELEAKILENGLCNGLRADIKIKLGQCQGKWKVESMEQNQETFQKRINTT